MQEDRIRIPVPPDFDFWRTVQSHGWYVLPPFFLDSSKRVLGRLVQTDRQLVWLELQTAGRAILAKCRSRLPLSDSDSASIKTQVVRMLRLDQSLQDFHSALQLIRGNGDFSWIIHSKAGRLLCGTSLFEDLVKMICTTNCSWSATERMVKNLVSELGTPFTAGICAFPTPQQLASSSERFLAEKVRAGYRSAYLLQLAEQVACGQLQLDELEHLESKPLYQRLISIKGVGPYAAGNLMRLLGHYDNLALDSWCRQKFQRLHGRRGKSSDHTIEKYYRVFGRWRGLVMWLDLTRDWFEDGAIPL
ncbi:MAG: Fe-S cluster assembly protein HesB [Acidobacteriota bacterium]